MVANRYAFVLYPIMKGRQEMEQNLELGKLYREKGKIRCNTKIAMLTFQDISTFPEVAKSVSGLEVKIDGHVWTFNTSMKCFKREYELVPEKEVNNYLREIWTRNKYFISTCEDKKSVETIQSRYEKFYAVFNTVE